MDGAERSVETMESLHLICIGFFGTFIIAINIKVLAVHRLPRVHDPRLCLCFCHHHYWSHHHHQHHHHHHYQPSQWEAWQDMASTKHIFSSFVHLKFEVESIRLQKKSGKSFYLFCRKAWYFFPLVLHFSCPFCSPIIFLYFFATLHIHQVSNM